MTHAQANRALDTTRQIAERATAPTIGRNLLPEPGMILSAFDGFWLVSSYTDNVLTLRKCDKDGKTENPVSNFRHVRSMVNWHNYRIHQLPCEGMILKAGDGQHFAVDERGTDGGASLIPCGPTGHEYDGARAIYYTEEKLALLTCTGYQQYNSMLGLAISVVGGLAFSALLIWLFWF